MSQIIILLMMTMIEKYAPNVVEGCQINYQIGPKIYKILFDLTLIT